MRVTLIYGMKSNLEVKIDRSPEGFRRTQLDLAGRVGLEGWRTVVPELYAEPPDASRGVTEVSLRTWNPSGVGTTRLPAGLLRLVKVARDEHDAPVRDGTWRETACHVAIWPDGAGFVSLSYTIGGAGTDGVASLRDEIDARREESTRTAVRMGESVVQALVQGLRSSGLEYRQDSSSPVVRILGRHRLVRMTADPSPALIEAIRENVVLLGQSGDFVNVAGDDDKLFCYAGFGVSVEVAANVHAVDSVLAPVLEYYEYWIAATATMDDLLSGEFTRLSAAARSSTYSQGDSRKNEALELFFDHEDVLNAMSPRHLTVWKSLMPTWRVPALERDIRNKISAIEELNRSMRETEANRVAVWTSSLVTFLTALTLVSLITGVAAFLSASAERLAPQIRFWLVVVSFFAALLLFSLSIGPVIKARNRSSGVRSSRREP